MMRTSIQDTTASYNGKTVKAKQLSVVSEVPMEVESVWKNVKTPALLHFVAKGIITFDWGKQKIPKIWCEGDNYLVKMKFFGFIPFGGDHYLRVVEINEKEKRIETQEKDNAAKVWNHSVYLRPLENGNTECEDSIVIYGGWMTWFITQFAKQFYLHRQRRWQLVAYENLSF